MSGSLFNPIPYWQAPHSVPSGTSDMAGAMIRPKAASLRQPVLNVLRAASPSGLCDCKGQKLLNLAARSCGPCCVELVNRGAVAKSGDPRPTPAARPVAAWGDIDHPGGEGGKP